MSSDTGKYHSFSSITEEDNNFQSKDEVDYVRLNTTSQTIQHQQNTGNHNNNNNNIDLKIIQKDTNYNDKSQCNLLAKKLIPGTLYGDCEVKTSIKSSLSTLEKLAIFNINRKRVDHQQQTSALTSTTTTTTASTQQQQQQQQHKSIKDKHKFVKSASIARLLGNTYNTKKFENDMKNFNAQNTSSNNCNHNNNSNNNNSNNNNSPINSSVKRFKNTERFQKCTNMENDINISSETCCLQDFRDDDKDFSVKAFRTISRSLGKLWWKRTHSVEISAPDPEYKVSYLGNVLTGWAKGEGCIEKPLNTLWRNYTQNHKPDVIMRIRVCASGLKATTRQHGLTEYWAHRITYCCSPKNYPKVFCWIYRHEGRKLKHELRCHAVLCSKESIAQDICRTLRENLDRALRDFKREKISRQNARLSLANAVYENPSLPRRKILLSVGGNNYRPPLERSKSAPKLMAIEEAIGEEDGEIEQTNEPEMPSCCVKDSMYPAMTLGRRRCRRGHSIRRTGKGFAAAVATAAARTALLSSNNTHHSECREHEEHEEEEDEEETKESLNEFRQAKVAGENELKIANKTKSISSLGSDEDDLEKLLSYHNYDTNSPLAGELLSYFDMKMKPKTSSLTNLVDNDNYDVFEQTLTSDPKPRPALSLDNLDSFSGEESADEDDDEDDDDDDVDIDVSDDVFYHHQAAILGLLHKTTNSSLLTDLCITTANDTDLKSEGSIKEIQISQQRQQQEHQHHHHHHHQQQQQQHQQLDSDEGSISSGCETASTVTANMDDFSLKYNNHHNEQKITTNYYEIVDRNSNKILSDPNLCKDSKNDYVTHQRNVSDNNVDDLNDNNNLKISNKTINFMLPKSVVVSKMNRNDKINQRIKTTTTGGEVREVNGTGDISDSEISDESGYVEFQEQNILQNRKKSISL